MNTIQAAQITAGTVQLMDVKRPAARVSPHDLAGIRNQGSAASAVDLAGWLRRVFRK